MIHVHLFYFIELPTTTTTDASTPTTTDIAIDITISPTTSPMATDGTQPTSEVSTPTGKQRKLFHLLVIVPQTLKLKLTNE